MKWEYGAYLYSAGTQHGNQTPSSGLRHPSLEEGAGKRCSECAQKVDQGEENSLAAPAGLEPGTRLLLHTHVASLSGNGWRKDVNQGLQFAFHHGALPLSYPASNGAVRN